MIEIINFTQLSYDEQLLVLSWRNTTKVRQNMHTNREIPLEEHLSFLESLKTNDNAFYFIVKKNDEYIGVIYLQENYLGIYSNPLKKGVGDMLLQEIIDFAFKTRQLDFLKAEVYTRNHQAINLYERFNFKTIKNTDELLTMELKNENR